MNDKRSIAVTTYGHKKIIDKITVGLFENSENSRTYYDTINSLEPSILSSTTKGHSIHARFRIIIRGKLQDRMRPNSPRNF